MKNATSKNRRILSLLIYWGSWTLVAVFFSIQIYADSLYAVRQGGQALTWLQALSLSLVEWYVWAVLGLAIFPLSRRFTFERSYWIRRLALHFLAAAFFALLKLLIHSTLSKMLPWASLYAPRPSFMVFSLAYLTYWEIIAIAHGISRLETAGEVSIRAGLHDGVLCIIIKDNGPGLKSHSDKETKTGIGLQNTRMRLAQLYGEHHAFEIRDDHGVEVKIGLPFHTRPLGETQR